MNDLPTFELFPDPLGEEVIEPSEETCDLCGLARGYMYTAGHNSDSPDTDEANICPWCIADGSAGERGVTFNDATIYPYLDTTPQMSEADKDLVERRTPGYVTWQGNRWLMCCGRACRYLGEAKEGDLRGRWSAAVPSIFEIWEMPADHIEEVIDLIGKSADPAAYVFECRICGGLKGYWDCA